MNEQTTNATKTALLKSYYYLLLSLSVKEERQYFNHFGGHFTSTDIQSNVQRFFDYRLHPAVFAKNFLLRFVQLNTGSLSLGIKIQQTTSQILW